MIPTSIKKLKLYRSINLFLISSGKTCNFLVLIISFLFAPNNMIAQKILKYSDHQPLDGMRTKFLNEVFFPAIEKESNGRLKIEAHWNGELAIAYDALGTVSKGLTVDIATVVPEYTAEQLPLHQFFKSFPVGPSGKKQVSFFQNVYAKIPEFSAELDHNNIVPIFLATGYPVGFFSRDYLQSLTEIKGKKWRTASFWHQDFLSNFGATPITMHWGQEIYKALEEKTLDGIMVNVDSGYDLKVYEHAPYLLASKNLWLGHLYLVTMNKDSWNALSEEDQKAIQRAAAISYKSLGKTMNESFDTQIETLKKGGTKIRLLEKKELKEFKEVTNFEEIQDKWAKKQQEKGVPNAADVLQKVRALQFD